MWIFSLSIYTIYLQGIIWFYGVKIAARCIVFVAGRFYERLLAVLNLRGFTSRKTPQDPAVSSKEGGQGRR